MENSFKTAGGGTHGQKYGHTQGTLQRQMPLVT